MELLANPSDPSWALEPLAQVIDAAELGDALLLQTQFLSPQAQMGQSGSNGIPIWNSAIIADLSDGSIDTTMMLFVYVTKNDADRAAARIVEGWSEPFTIDSGFLKFFLDREQGPEDEQTTPQEISKSLSELIGADVLVRVFGEGPYVTTLTFQTPVARDSEERPYNKGLRFIAGLIYSEEISLFGLH